MKIDSKIKIMNIENLNIQELDKLELVNIQGGCDNGTWGDEIGHFVGGLFGLIVGSAAVALHMVCSAIVGE